MITDSGAKLANYLLDINAVKISPDDPYTWTSGLRSPIYCDNRQILSYPDVRDFVKSDLKKLALTHFPDAIHVSGVATAGIAIGALLADSLALPFSYVRPEPKKHGMKNQIEGKLEPGQKVLVVEDLVSTGKSSLAAIEALRAGGAEVVGMLALFSYNFTETQQKFAEAGVKLVTLSDLEQLLPVAIQKGYLDPDKQESLKRFIADPAGWWEE